jgi:hypothetical protein
MADEADPRWVDAGFALEKRKRNVPASRIPASVFSKVTSSA